MVSPGVAPLSRGRKPSLHRPSRARGRVPVTIPVSRVLMSTPPMFTEGSRMVWTLEYPWPTSLTIPTSPSLVITGHRRETPW